MVSQPERERHPAIKRREMAVRAAVEDNFVIMSLILREKLQK
jgi:hypothetical protein